MEMSTKRCRLAVVLMSCAAAISLQFSGSTASAAGLGQLVHKKNSLYHRILVYRRGSVVTLRFGSSNRMLVESQVDLRNLRRHLLEYTTLTFAGLLYKPEPERMLVVGLGGGVIPREMHFHFPELEIDVAEIDPEIPSIAERFFAFREDERLKVHVDDGRMFVKKQLRRKPVPKYDYVVLDAFNGGYIPFHLMTKEFLEEVKGVLADDGVVVANVFYSNRLFDAELRTFLAVFGRCQAYFGSRSTNAILVALGPSAPTLTADEAMERAKELRRKHNFAFDLRVVADRLRPDTRPDSRAEVLTDDRAPVNWLRDQETGRRPTASGDTKQEDSPGGATPTGGEDDAERAARRLWVLGEGYLKNNTPAGARRTFEELITEHPDTDYARKAEERLSQLEDE